MNKISERYAHLSPLKQALLAVEEMSSKLAQVERKQTEPIAIIGMGCRFPGGANNPELFWQLLQHGVDAMQEVPSQRWDIDAYYDPNPDTPGKMYTRQGGFLDVGVDEFDAEFFGLAPREVMSMDPQQRLLLEVSWEALEKAGIAPSKLIGSQTGVFIGINTSDYSQLHVNSEDNTQLNAYFFTGNTASVAAGRLSYILGLEGPSLALDTACSSSLVTVHLACQSLRAGECHLALAGGVNLMLLPEGPIILSRMRALAADGRCKTFDAAADGYGRGEGCAIVVLKRLSDAIAHGDNILALIRGSAVNHDGRSSGLTVPNGLAQQKLIRTALANAKVEPHLVSYVEAHGTGTALGDPIEVEALGSALASEHPHEQPLMIGSVKTNIGHLEAAAGVASLIKVVLAMQHKQIPPHLHLQNPNPSISWENLPVAIPTELTPWLTATGQRRFAGVSSFGMSGTNAHVILEEAPVVEPPVLEVERPMHLLTLSAKTEAALKDMAGRMISYLETDPSTSLGDVCFTANTGRAHFAHRLAVVAEEPTQIVEKLTAFATGITSDRLLSGQVTRNSRAKVAFLFTGQGSQYVDMGRHLYETQPTFQKALERCDKLLRPYLEKPLLSVLYPEAETTSPLDETAYTQPALFALEYALFELWRSWGITPEVVIGHSVGEYVAACVAGVFSLEDGLKLIAHRAQLMQALPPNGAMAAIFANEATVTAAIRPYAQKVSIAAINGANNIVISGEHKTVQTVVSALEAKGIESRRLNVSHAFHSPLMEPMLDAFEQIAVEVKYSSPKIRLVSNVTGKLVDATEITQAKYWRRHIREAVKFSAGMQTLHEQGYQVFLEVGPHPVLIGMGRRCLSENNGVWLPSLRKGQSDWQQLLQSLVELYIRGAEINWHGFDQDYSRRRVQLPTYPFQRSPYWIRSTKPKTQDGQKTKNDQPLYADWLYEVDWLPKSHENDLTVTQSNEHGSWLIFADENSGVGSTLATLLKERGQNYILVFPGETYKISRAGYWKINPAQPEDFQQLLGEVLGSDKPPLRGIVHLWSLDSVPTKETTTHSLETNQLQNCASVLHVVQALSSAKIANLPRLWLVTQGVQSIKSETNTNSVAVAQSPVLGLSRVVALEHPEIWGGLVDLDADNSEQTALALLKEIWQSDGESQVAFRQGQRYVSRLVRSESQNLQTKPLELQPDHTYLITDGLSSLALHLAKWMIDQGARHLVLLENSSKPVSSHASIQLQQMQEAGAKIKVFHSDISQNEQITEIFSDIAQSFPPLKGIIYVDDAIDDKVLLKQDWDSFAKFLNPRIAGAWNLHTQTQNMPLDFFVLFSSIVSVIGSPAQGNYAAANAFLDVLAHHRQLQKLPVLSVNWSPWSETDIASALGKQGEQRWKAIGVSLTPPAQGLEILEQLLSPSSPQKIVMSVNWSRFFEQFPAGIKPPFLSAIAHEAQSNQQAKSGSDNQQSQILQRLEKTPPNQRLTLLMSYIQREVAIVLERDPSQPLSTQMGFFDMGMDSLMALDLKNRIQVIIGQNLPATLIFEYSNIEALAQYLISEFISEKIVTKTDIEAQEEAEERAKLLQEIQEFSQEELEALIERELQNL